MAKTKAAGWAERAGKAGGEGVVEGLRAKFRPFLEEEVGPFWKKLHEEVPGTARETVRQAAEEIKDVSSRAVQSVSLPVGLGAASGAAAAPENERGRGAARGAFGGLGGGLLGAAWGRKLSPNAYRALTTGGSILGGAGAGATLHGGDTKARKPVKHKYAGVVIDFYDDKGATLRDVFPTVESLPDVIKTASVCPQENLGNEDFALIALDEGYVMRKFACHDPGTTAMSVVYFMEHGDKLPENAQKLAAVNLVRACNQYGMRPPAAMLKTAGMNQLLRHALLGGGVGAGVGAAGGALAAGEGHRGRGALIGGSVGGLAGAGLGALGSHTTARNIEEVFAEAKGEMARMGESFGEGFGDDAVRGFEEEAGPVRDQAMRLGRPIAAGVGGLAGGGAGALASAYASDQSKTATSQMAMGMKVEREHTDSPEVAKKIARDHLEEIPDYYTRLDKMETQAKQANVVDITGKSPAPKFKTAAPFGPNDYAVVLNGRGYYPIHTWDLVKTAEAYYQDENRRMQPEIRRQYATKLASKAAGMGYPLDPNIFEAGAPGWAPSGHLKAAVEMRKIACAPRSEDRKFLDELFEKRASLQPGTYAEVLRRFDVQNGFDKGWDTTILDPWTSTFGLNKVADVVWEDGADRVTSEQLSQLATGHAKRLCDVLTSDMKKEFMKDPVGIFESMPLPQKRVIARLASDHAEYSEVSQDAGGAGA